MSCPKGYYEKDGRCVKGIVIKRHGIYGTGFLSRPQSQQYSKIRKEEKIEGSNLVEKQMSALNAFNHSTGSAHKDLLYAEKIEHSKQNQLSNKDCPSGYIYVSPYKRNGRLIKAHCRRQS